MNLARARVSFWRTIEHQHIKPALRRMRPYREAAYAGVRVSYKQHLDGGGSTFGQDFVPLLRQRGMPKVARAFEWCAGPGFIGFSLLAQELCDTLCLADVNPEAVAACQRSVARNRLEAKVAVYLSDNLEDIPACRAMGPGGQQPAAFHRQRHRTPALSRSGLARAPRLLRDGRATPQAGRRRGAAGEQCRLHAGHIHGDDRGRRDCGSCSCRMPPTRAPCSRICTISASCGRTIRFRPGRRGSRYNRSMLSPCRLIS